MTLPPLPESTPIYTNCYSCIDWFTADQMHAYAAAAVAAERERCAAIACRWGETHADGVTVNARNAASKIARAISLACA